MIVVSKFGDVGPAPVPLVHDMPCILVVDPDCRAGLTIQTPNVTYLLAVPKVYPICLFASLNSRIVISREMTNHMTFVSTVSDP